MKYLRLTSLLLLLSCQKSYDLDACNKLSMKKFKGVPNAAYEFDQNCNGVAVTYSQEVCQQALNQLTQTQNLEQVQEQFGDEIVDCFTGDDLRRFNKIK